MYFSITSIIVGLDIGSFGNTCYILWYFTWCSYSSWLFDFQSPSLTAWYSVTRIFMCILSKLGTSKFLNVCISNGFRGPDIWEMWLQEMQSDARQIYIMCQNWHNHNAPLSDSWLSLTTISSRNRCMWVSTLGHLNSVVRRSRPRRCCAGCKGPTGQDESRHQGLSLRSESIKIG